MSRESREVARRLEVWLPKKLRARGRLGRRIGLSCTFARVNGASIRILALVTVGVFSMVEVEHPSVRPSARVLAQKVARSGKLGNVRTA